MHKGVRARLQNDAVYRHPGPSRPSDIFSVVLTRYSLRTGLATQVTANNYLESRFPIFKTICYPSILQQVRRPDFWLIAFNTTTRKAVQPVLEVISKHPWIHPVWQDSDSGSDASAGMLTLFADAIRQRIPAHARWLLTTRLDSDDALALDYNLLIQKYATSVANKQLELEDFWITFPFGAQMMDGTLRLSTDTTGPFLSRCELISRFARQKSNRTTANEGTHRTVFERGPVFLPVSTQPMWLQNIHESNVHNKANLSLPVLSNMEDMLMQFGIDKDAVLAQAPSSRPVKLT